MCPHQRTSFPRTRGKAAQSFLPTCRWRGRRAQCGWWTQSQLPKLLDTRCRMASQSSLARHLASGKIPSEESHTVVLANTNSRQQSSLCDRARRSILLPSTWPGGPRYKWHNLLPEKRDRAAMAQVGARLRLASGESVVHPRIVRRTGPSWISHNRRATRSSNHVTSLFRPVNAHIHNGLRINVWC